MDEFWPQCSRLIAAVRPASAGKTTSQPLQLPLSIRIAASLHPNVWCVCWVLRGVPPEDNLAPVDCLYLSETTDVDLLWKQVAEAESRSRRAAVSPDGCQRSSKTLPTNLAFHNTTQHNTGGKTAAAAKFYNVKITQGGFLIWSLLSLWSLRGA